MKAERPARLHLSSRYEVIRELGSGGMGRVLLVRDAYLKEDLALKLLHDAPAPESVEDLKREFALLAEVRHPGIARAHDFGYAAGRPFFTREYVPGSPLAENGWRADRAAFLEMARRMAEALSFLHRGGILHLDIKPGNIIVRDGAGPPCPVLIDFGLFRQGVPDSAGGKLRGSLPFMAPEYFGGGALGPWTDVYALGVTLYRSATGRYPRRGPAAAAGRPAANGAWEPALPRAWERRSSLGRDVQDIVLGCLALDPRARFASAGDLLRAIEVVCGGGRSLRARAPAQSIPRTVGRESELQVIDGFLDGPGTDSRLEGAGPALLLVTGPPGWGQSHLLRELKLRAQTRGVCCYLVRGHEGSRGSPGATLSCLEAHLEPRARRQWSAFLSGLRRPAGSSGGESFVAERRLRGSREVRRALASLKEPLVIAIDGLQHMDEITVDVVVQMARALAPGGAVKKPRFGLALGYREEGPAVRLLRELTVHVLEAGRGTIVPLVPLGPGETLELFRARRRSEGKAAPAAGAGDGEGFDVFQRTCGVPARIVELAISAPEKEERLPAESPEPASGLRLDREDRMILLALALLRKPVKAAAIARLIGLPRGRVSRRLRSLSRDDLAREDDASAAPGLWIATPAADAAVSRSSAREKRRVHAAAAREVLRKPPSSDAPELFEAVRHAHAAGLRTLFLAHAPRLAAYLKSTYQNGAALELLRRVEEALPSSRARQRAAAALDIAEVLGRIGDLDGAIETLRRAREGPARPGNPWRTRILLRLATLHSRRGDFLQAESLFTAGLERGPEGSRRLGLGRDEYLHYLSEHAAMKAFTGETEAAARLCEDGIRLAAELEEAPARDLLLDFHATRANIALRSFDFEQAIAGFREALRTAEETGSMVHRAVVLNNLGIVYSQCDRFREAIESFEAAREASVELGEGPSLVFIHGNLGLLYSKTGDFAALDRMLDASSNAGSVRTSPRPGSVVLDAGPREELFREHHRGLALLNRGRHGAAVPHLEAAIRIGIAMGDRLATAFDEVYRAEALIFTADHARAESELRRIAASEEPDRVRLMALSRRAYLLALLDRKDDAAKAIREHDSISVDRPVPYLDAWDDLFIAWALSVGGVHASALERLDRCEDYFRRNGLRPAGGLAGWVRAESHFLRGDTGAAAALLATVEASSDLLRVLRPLLEGRCLIETARTTGEKRRSADLLVEAGAGLAGNALPEWALRLEAARAAFPGAGSDLAAIERERRSLTRGLPEAEREGHARSAHWRIWSRRLERAAVIAATPHPGSAPAITGSRTVALRGSAGDSARQGIVARSEAMRSLLGALERLRESELHVVIRGETGAGKDMVARLLHAESPRFRGPLRVLDCAALPLGLLEVELFGARRGAFTDLTEDRPGLLAQAAGGTLLVDGVGNAPLELQAKLLRVLSAGAYRPVGAEAEVRTDVRFIFSSSRDIEDEMRQGRLREDLFHRIRVLVLEVPPLRDRLEDLSDLVDIFLHEGEGPGPELAEGVIEELCSLEWPGNVRELKNLITRLRFEHPEGIPVASIRSSGSRSSAPLLPGRLLSVEPLEKLKDRIERDYLLFHLRRLKGDKALLSRLLGLSLTHTYRRLKQLGIDVREERRKGWDR